MTTTTVAGRDTCGARVGFFPGEFAEMPLFCSASIGLTTWPDGRTRRGCRHHLAQMLHRFPERYVSEIADDPLGQAKARYEDRDELAGTHCWYAGHVPGCAGRVGGERELLPGWITYEDADGDAVEVEVSGA
jgi:hypothetical protein